jgi:hypothetical protein
LDPEPDYARARNLTVSLAAAPAGALSASTCGPAWRMIGMSLD